VLYGVFVFVQTVRHRDYFLSSHGGNEEAHADPPPNWQAWTSMGLLVVALVAVVGLAKSLSQELAERHVLVNVVAPGIIDTERVRELDEANAAAQKKSVEEVAGERIKSIPLQRMGQAEEVANLVVFLASARASYITGTTIAVDGGLIRGV